MPASATAPGAPWPRPSRPEAEVLPRLRPDLRLHRAPRQAGGAPAWTLEDPLRGQYVRIGWTEMEMLSRWSLGHPEAIAAAIGRDTTLAPSAADVRDFATALGRLHLLVPAGRREVDQMWHQAQERRLGWARWLLRNYLFVRLPLVRPDRLLTRTLPLVRPLGSRAFLLATLVAAVVGLVLAAHQWDTFRHTFLHFFTLEGAAVAALTLALTKVAHELGHAYACKAQGLRVPTMGVAFLVLWPVLYTDTTAAWTLTRRRKRLLIGGAGMMTELAIAAWATLAWSFLPDGMLHSAAFLLATTTWIMTLAVNLSPLMRFDGYFLLSDLLDMPNLQHRAFALTRWRLRETLFGLGDPPPERFAPWLQRTLIVYAVATWVYRFFLFLGIALLVYHYAFKLLGLLLFAVEIGSFILAPILREGRVWWSRREAYTMNRHTILTGLTILGALAAAVLPWRTSIAVPGLLRAAEETVMVMPVGGQVRDIFVEPGDRVTAGQSLFRLEAPDDRHALAQIEREMAGLRAQSRFQVRQEDDAARQHIARQALDVALRRRDALARQVAALDITAPFDGRVADMAAPLAEGSWHPEGDWLATLTGTAAETVEAYVGERDRARLTVGDAGWFLPEDIGAPRRPLRIVAVAETATRDLGSVPELASPHGGPLAAHDTEQGPPVPEDALYRVLLAPVSPGPAPARVLRGWVTLEAAPESPLGRLWSTAVAVIIRESAF